MNPTLLLGPFTEHEAITKLNLLALQYDLEVIQNTFAQNHRINIRIEPLPIESERFIVIVEFLPVGAEGDVDLLINYFVEHFAEVDEEEAENLGD